jgi:5'-deoxy-5'-methylthioadenosine phosphorylase
MSIAVIGGSGLDQLEGLAHGELIERETPFGAHSVGVYRFSINRVKVVFLPRHGENHQYPPHGINYRANLWLLKSLGITKIIACNVVGGIDEVMPPRTLAVPHQIIDYTWGRDHTYFDGQHAETPFVGKAVDHIDFTQPYSEALRQRVLSFLEQAGIAHVNYGTYGCTQGPRLETAAEVNRLDNDGCDLVGMTAMPEASLAAELEIDYAALSLVVNWAPGIAEEELSIDSIMRIVNEEMSTVRDFLPNLIEFIALDH